MNVQISSADQARRVVPRVAEAGSSFSRIYRGLLAGLGVACLLVSAPALAAIAPPLGTAAGYAALGPTAVTCTDSTINGDVGTRAPVITDSLCTHNGTWNTMLPGQIDTDINAAKGAVDSQTCDTIQFGTLAGVTLAPGVHCFTAGAALTGLLKLSGPSNGIWIFRIGTTGPPADLAATDFTVQMDGGGQACNVYWRSSQDATVTRGSFLGTILSGRDVTFTGLATVGSPYGGRLLATGSLTMTDARPLTFAGCAAPTPGSITIDKTAVGGDATFGYTGSATLGAPFNIITAGGTGSHVTTGLSAGTYTVTETAGPAGWVRTGLACTDSTAGSTFGYSGATATINLATGGTVTCTYTNARAGSITINKTAVGGDATFGYTASAALGTSFNITTASGTGNHQTTGLSAGTYTVTESTVPAGWVLTNLVCTDSSGAGSGFSYSGAQATITFAAGGIVSCTYTNASNSTITVNKDFIPNNAATVPMTLACPSGTVAIPTLPATETAPAVFTVTGAAPGTTCTATETVPAGYIANQANCLTVPLNGSCTITNTLTAAAAVPTLSEWAMIMLAAFLAITGFAAMRRQTR